MLHKILNSAFVFVAIFCCSASICFAQGTFSEYKNSEYKGKGIAISAGSNSAPSGRFGVISYRMEEIKLPKPFELGDNRPPIENAFRLVVITDKKMPMETFSIWLGDTPMDATQIGPRAVAAIIYSRTLINGSKLALSAKGVTDSSALSVLPESLFVPPPYATSSEEIAARTPIIVLKRLATNFPLIELRIENTGGTCTIGGMLLSIEVGDEDLGVDCNGNSYVTRLSLAEFGLLVNGSEVALRYGSRREGRRRVIGRLNKGLLQ
jgi:hypothetical protein